MTKHLKIIVFLTLALFVVSFLYYLERAKEPEVITQTQVLYETLEVKAEPEEPYQYEAVDEVIWNGPTMPSWVQYFRANYHHNWSSSYTPYCVYGNTYFGGFAG